LVSQVLDEQRKWEKHIPSNMDARSNSIHISETEFKDLIKGNGLSLNHILPIVLFKMDVQLQKKKPQQEELNEEQQEERRKQEMKDKKKKKAVEENTEAPLEDLALKDI
jgi:hypothetical protein